MELNKATSADVRKLSQVLRDDASGKSRATMTDIDLAADLLELIAEADPQRVAACLSAFGNMRTASVVELASIGGVQGLTNYSGAQRHLNKLLVLTLENVKAAIEAFQDPEGNMPAATGEFAALFIVLGQVEKSLQLHNELRSASGAAPAGGVQ